MDKVQGTLDWVTVLKACWALLVLAFKLKRLQKLYYADAQGLSLEHGPTTLLSTLDGLTVLKACCPVLVVVFKLKSLK
jgi:hypothetical protein